LALAGAAAWPLAARAQQSREIPRIGVLWPNPVTTFEFMRQGLKDLGYVEGQNVAFEFRWAEGKLDQLPELAAELVRLQVDVIVTLAPQATLAAKDATQTIPIVFVAMGDPVASGVVSSLARPGANLTGTTRMISEMSAKHVELIKEAVPSLAKLAVLWNPTNSSHVPALQAVDAAARAVRRRPPCAKRCMDALNVTIVFCLDCICNRSTRSMLPLPRSTGRPMPDLPAFATPSNS
jgi:putative ABC transport system substrate-binding protein